MENILNDQLQLLYGLRNKDVNYLVGFMETKVVCMKNTKVNADIMGRPIIPLIVASAQ